MTDTTTISLPDNSAQAQESIFKLRERRVGLVESIEGAAARRRANAALAALGNAPAQAELERAEADEQQARSALGRLNDATSAMEAHYAALRRTEQEARAVAESERLSAKVDVLLDLDDQIDERCEELRSLFRQRREMLEGGLQGAGRFNSTSSRGPGYALLSFFEDELWFLRERQRYSDLTTVAQSDGRAFGRSSLRSTARGPRAPTVVERALRRDFETPATNGFRYGGSSVQNVKGPGEVTGRGGPNG